MSYWGTDRMAAEKMTMANPVWIQMRITMRKKLFQKGMEIHTCGAPPNQATMALRMPICSWPSPRSAWSVLKACVLRLWFSRGST